MLVQGIVLVLGVVFVVSALAKTSPVEGVENDQAAFLARIHIDRKFNFFILSIIMKKTIKSVLELKALSVGNRGVFTRSDLATILEPKSRPSLNWKIKELIDAKALVKIARGLYADETATLEGLALRLYPDGYISLGYALALHRLTGTIPGRKIEILTSRPRGRRIKTPMGEVQMSVHANHLHFGYIVRENGLRLAVPEKAVLDMLYFHLRGYHFQFDIAEVNYGTLNGDVLRDMLARYRNPKFQTFVKGVINGHG